MSLIINGFLVQGSVIAPRAIHNKMLEFAAVHNIRPMIEKFPLDKESIDKAFEHLDHEISISSPFRPHCSYPLLSNLKLTSISIQLQSGLLISLAGHFATTFHHSGRSALSHSIAWADDKVLL